jgi:hypothetical protein
MAINCLGPLRTCTNPAIIPLLDVALSPQTREMFGKLVAQIFVLVGIRIKDLDSFRSCCGHRVPSLRQRGAQLPTSYKSTVV